MIRRAKRRRFRTLILTLAGIAMTLMTDWTVRYMLTQRDLARRSATELAACEAFATQIKALRDKPAVAQAGGLSDRALGERITAASNRAGLAGDQWLQSVEPQRARALGDLPYQLKPTRFALRGVTLVQLASFLHYLTGDAGLSVHDLRFRTPHGDAATDVWNAEATVTYLIYAPSKKTGLEN